MDYPITPSTMARDLLMLSPMVSLSTLVWPPAMLVLLPMVSLICTMAREMLSLRLLQKLLLKLKQMLMLSTMVTMDIHWLMVVMDMDSQVATHLSVEFMDMDIHMPTGVNLLQLYEILAAVIVL